VASAQPPLAVLGATGYTGGLVLEEARRLGVPLRLVGRDRGALEPRAVAGDELRVADARDERSLRDAFDGAFAVASVAGPFMELGHAPVAAAIDGGAHYVDISGEQDFSRRVYEEYGRRAEEAGVVALTAFGFDYVPGDLAARLAGEGLEPLDEILVAYAVGDAAVSPGTRRSMARLIGAKHLAWEGGRLIESRFGSSTRTVRFPSGEASVVEWGATEPLTVPRHTQSQRVRSYVRAPKFAAKTAGLARLAAPLVRASGMVGTGPSAQRRARARFSVVAEAHGPNGSRRVSLTGRDFYGLTARLVVRAAEALRNGEVRASGALAPAEAFDARSLLERLAPLIAIQTVEDL